MSTIKLLVAILVFTSVSAQVAHYPPTPSNLNNLTFVLNGFGSPGIFNSSVTPDKEYGIYNRCNTSAAAAVDASVSPSLDMSKITSHAQSTMSNIKLLVAILVSTSVSAQVVHYPPTPSNLNDLTFVLNGSGAPGIFTSSVTPEEEYGIYNWCNMPHVRTKEYKYVYSSLFQYNLESTAEILFAAESHPRTIPFNTWRSSNVTINAHHTRQTRFSRKISRGLVSVRVLCMQ